MVSFFMPKIVKSPRGSSDDFSFTKGIQHPKRSDGTTGIAYHLAMEKVVFCDNGSDRTNPNLVTLLVA